MEFTNKYLQSVVDKVKANDASQPEFIQTLEEFLKSIEQFI